MDPQQLLCRNGLSSSPPIIAVVGSLTHDMIFETDQIPKVGESRPATSLTTAPGGKGANIAVAAYRASHNKPNPGDLSTGDNRNTTDNDVQIFMNGAVGSDSHGPSLRTSLAEIGIDVTGVLTLQGERTGQVAVIVQTPDGQSSSVGFKGANLLYQPRDDTIECLAGSSGRKLDVVVTHCTLRLETVERILEMGARSGIETVLSLSPAVKLDRETYKWISHLVFNEHEAAEVSGRPAKDFADTKVAMDVAATFVGHGVTHVVITLGEAGAVYATHRNQRGHVPAVKDAVVRDTTGAGDSFLGAYVVSLVRQRRAGGWDIEKAVSSACRAAARAIGQLGAQTALPWADEIGRS